MGTEDPERVEGVDFRDVNPVIEDLSYPVTAEELVEEHGDLELGRTNADPIAIRELLQYMGEDTFESPEGLREMLMAQMPRDSGGRSNYSDRGGSNPTITEDAEQAEDATAADEQEGESTDPDTKQQPD